MMVDTGNRALLFLPAADGFVIKTGALAGCGLHL
jgi:hypothetical protein